MRKWQKRITVLVVLLLFVLMMSIAAFIWLGVAVGRGYEARDYQTRHVECDPGELLPVLEKLFDVNFPQGLRDVKAAKSLEPFDGVIFFIVKFTADPDTVNGFFKTFPKKIRFTPYDAEYDGRIRSGTWPPPAWFTKPIQKGMKARHYIGHLHGSTVIYIDSTDEQNYVVYLHGSY